eukprot:351537-Chlamydomonas_euryale.AAC.4
MDEPLHSDADAVAFLSVGCVCPAAWPAVARLPAIGQKGLAHLISCQEGRPTLVQEEAATVTADWGI